MRHILYYKRQRIIYAHCLRYTFIYSVLFTLAVIALFASFLVFD